MSLGGGVETFVSVTVFPGVVRRVRARGQVYAALLRAGGPSWQERPEPPSEARPRRWWEGHWEQIRLSRFVNQNSLHQPALFCQGNSTEIQITWRRGTATDLR